MMRSRVLPGLLITLAACEAAAPNFADPRNASQVAAGRHLYAEYCAACHGTKLEGQADWKVRLPNGRLPAPPHDESGHTWHHADQALFGIVKNGLAPYAGAGYQSDMPAFKGTLSDEQIWAILAYIKSSWPARVQQIQAKITAEQR